jgi:hypothetical protein
MMSNMTTLFTAFIYLQLWIYSASHSKVAPENVGLHLRVIPVWNAVVTWGAGNVLLYVQCTLDLLQLCRRTWAQLFAAVITHAHALSRCQLVMRRDARWEIMTGKLQLTTPAAGNTSFHIIATWVAVHVCLDMVEKHLWVVECSLTVIPTTCKCFWQVWYQVLSNLDECASLLHKKIICCNEYFALNLL